MRSCWWWFSNIVGFSGASRKLGFKTAGDDAENLGFKEVRVFMTFTSSREDDPNPESVW